MTIHVYAQSQWHDEAYIAGNRSALRELRDAIDRAIAAPDGLDKVTTFAEDGEGYDLHVMSLPEEVVHKLAVPYTDPIAAEKNEAAVRPWTILKAANEKKTPRPAADGNP